MFPVMGSSTSLTSVQCTPVLSDTAFSDLISLSTWGPFMAMIVPEGARNAEPISINGASLKDALDMTISNVPRNEASLASCCIRVFTTDVL